MRAIDLSRSLKTVGKRGVFQCRFRYHLAVSSSIREAITYNPLGTITIPVSSLQKMMRVGEELCSEYPPGSIVSGDWDRRTKLFDESLYYRSLERHFIHGVTWTETTLYENVVERDLDNLYHGCETPDEVLDRLEYLDSVYGSITKHGYLSQRELREKGIEKPSTTPPELDEVRISISREGEPIFDDGRHRLAIAKLLDVEKIPVIIIGRHRQWWEAGGTVDELEKLE